MTVLRLFWLDVQKLFTMRIMTFFIVLPALLGFNGWFVAIAFLVYIYLVPYGMFSYDDNSIADNLYGALPVRREQMVAARYLFALFCMALMLLLMLAVNTAIGLFLRQPLLAEGFLLSLLLGFVMGLVFVSVAFPLVMHFGLRKATNNVLMVFVLAFIIVGFYGDRLRDMHTLPQVNAQSLAAFCLVLLAVSYMAALRLFKKREFYDYVPLGAVRRTRKR
jgi:hypothetical protein